MAKSAGNFFRITELEDQGFDPLAFRYLALQARYRAPLNFSTEGLAGADRALRQLRARVAEWSVGSRSDSGGEPEVWESRFRDAIANDLDMPAAMALVAELTRSPLAASAKASLIKAWDGVLGLDLDRASPQPALPNGAAGLLEAREKARAAKDFTRSDQLREELARLGVMVIDTPAGQRIRR